MVRNRFATLEMQVRLIKFRRARFTDLDSPSYTVGMETAAILRNGRTGAMLADRRYFWAGSPRQLIDWLKNDAAEFQAELDRGMREAAIQAVDDFMAGFVVDVLPDTDRMPNSRSTASSSSVGIPQENSLFCWRQAKFKLPDELKVHGGAGKMEQVGYRIRLRVPSANASSGPGASFVFGLIPRAPTGKIVYEGSGASSTCEQIRIDPAWRLDERKPFDLQHGVFEWYLDTWVKVDGQFHVHLIPPRTSVFRSKLYFMRR